MKSYKTFTLIDDSSPLAGFFNSLMKDMQCTRTLVAPSSFNREAEIAGFEDEKFCDFCRYEVWMHSVIERLNFWCDEIKEYMNEFEGNWKYFAASSRLSSIKEYGGEDDDFYEDGTIRKEGLDDSVYEPFSIVSYLSDGGFNDIVVNTHIDDLKGMLADIVAISHIDLFANMKKAFGSNIEAYKKDENGVMRKVSSEEHDMDVALKKVSAADNAERVKCIIDGIELIVRILKSFEYNNDNKEGLQTVSVISTALLNMDFKAVNRIKESIHL